MAEAREAPFGHEPPGVATRRVVGVVLTLGSLVGVALIAIWFVLRYLVLPEYVQLQTRPGVLPPEPRLQPSHAHRDLEKLRAEKAALLSGYAWTGPAHRFARIPIERAMEIYVAEQKRKPGVGTRDPGRGGGKSELGTGKPGPGTRHRGPGTPRVSASSGRRP